MHREIDRERERDRWMSWLNHFGFVCIKVLVFHFAISFVRRKFNDEKRLFPLFFTQTTWITHFPIVIPVYIHTVFFYPFSLSHFNSLSLALSLFHHFHYNFNTDSLSSKTFCPAHFIFAASSWGFQFIVTVIFRMNTHTRNDELIMMIIILFMEKLWNS